MFRTRHSIEALLMAKASRRSPPRRAPSAIEIALGLGAFVGLAAGVLFLAATLGG